MEALFRNGERPKPARGHQCPGLAERAPGAVGTGGLPQKSGFRGLGFRVWEFRV